MQMARIQAEHPIFFRANRLAAAGMLPGVFFPRIPISDDRGVERSLCRPGLWRVPAKHLIDTRIDESSVEFAKVQSFLKRQGSLSRLLPVLILAIMLVEAIRTQSVG